MTANCIIWLLTPSKGSRKKEHDLFVEVLKHLKQQLSIYLNRPFELPPVLIDLVL